MLCLLEGIGFVFGLVGASTGNIIEYILPALFYLAVLRMTELETQGRDPSLWWKSPLGSWFTSQQKIFATSLLFVGFSFMGKNNFYFCSSLQQNEI
jgi:hypothetical protein